jgi:hypothetical protein
MQDTIFGLVTKVDRAADSVIDDRRAARQAAGIDITHLCTVAEQSVVAGDIRGNVSTRVLKFVAPVERAVHAIVTVYRVAGNASFLRIADLGAVAVQSVRAEPWFDLVNDPVDNLVTAIDRAFDTVACLRRAAALTAAVVVAELGTIAELSVVADLVNGDVNTRVPGFVAGVRSAIDRVEAGVLRAGDTSGTRITDFGAVAKRTVVTQVVADGVAAHIEQRIARILGAAHTIIADGRRTGGAARAGVAAFHPVAEDRIVTDDIYGLMDAAPQSFDASISRAIDAVVALRSRSCEAPQSRAARLDTVADHTVVTASMVDLVDAGRP